MQREGSVAGVTNTGASYSGKWEGVGGKGGSSEADGHIKAVTLMHHHQGAREGGQWTA